MRPAEPLDLAALERAQYFRLRHRVHVADFVEKERAAGRQLEFPLALLGGARERAALVAEKFRFDQVFRQRRAVYGDKRLFGARRPRVNFLREQVLARAALA